MYKFDVSPPRSVAEESEDDDSDGADILINGPDRSELVNFNNPFSNSADWTKQGPGAGAGGSLIKQATDQRSRDRTLKTPGVD